VTVLISASQVARITGVSHQSLANVLTFDEANLSIFSSVAYVFGTTFKKPLWGRRGKGKR
jgi:hypothetical protein